MEYDLKNGNVEITVLQKGAELKSLKKGGVEFMWERNPEFWGKSSPILFPFVGSLKDNKFKFDGKEYEIETRHGFARDNDFELAEKGENFLKFLFKSNEKTLEMYPFNFELYLTYKIENDKLEMKYEVISTDNREMYFSVGAHPAFATPVSDEITLEDYYLELSEKETVETFMRDGVLLQREKKACLNNENRINLGGDTFADDAIIFENVKSQKVSLKCKKNTRELEMDYTGFPYIAFWSMANAPFVCIEPWHGISDYNDASGELAEKAGIEKTNGRFTAKLSISMKV